MAITLKAREEAPADRALRLRESVHYWLWQAIQAIEEPDVHKAIECTRKAEETAVTLRKHLEGF